MAQATDHAGATRPSDARLIVTVGAAHFVSHYYILILPPLFAFVRADYGVSYTELGLALAAFNVTSAILQTPAGFLVDRIGARLPLFAALMLGGIAFAVVGLTHSFWLLVAMFALAGVGNAVYHPADYALLSHEVATSRAAKAYSIHTFAGMLGSAAAPVTLLMMQSQWGWRGAFLGAASIGFAVALLVIAQPSQTTTHAAATTKSAATDAPAGWQLLLSPPILINFALFTLLALLNAGLQNYSVVALGALYGTAVVTANVALTSYLTFAAFGVLVGGALAARVARHNAVAAAGLVATGLAALVIAGRDPGSALLIAAMAAAGLASGTIMPSRDLLVRQVTPPGAFGKVFGFVTTGFNIAGIAAPMLFGLLMDYGQPQLVFVLVAAFCALAVGTVVIQRPKPAP
ncbi:MAG: MFS transporter [Pseudolabrys sp.]